MEELPEEERETEGMALRIKKAIFKIETAYGGDISRSPNF